MDQQPCERLGDAARLCWKVILFAALLAGCRGDPYRTYDVRGHVKTCEGKPAAGGVVVFAPIDDPAVTGRPKGNPGREARGTIGADGAFSLTTIGIKPSPGAVAGRHQVSFEMPPTRRPTLLAEERAGMSAEEIKKIEDDFASRPLYPPISCGDQIQPAEVTVKAGRNEFEFTLPPKS